MKTIRKDHYGFAWQWWKAELGFSRLLQAQCPAAIIRAIFPKYAEDEAIRVAKCESDHGVYLNPDAKNPYSSASGLFQLLSTWWAGRGDPFDPWFNTKVAHELWKGSGGTFAVHWRASIGCWG